MKTEQIIEEREDSVKMKMRFKRFLSGFMAVATLASVIIQPVAVSASEWIIYGFNTRNRNRKENSQGWRITGTGCDQWILQLSDLLRAVEWRPDCKWSVSTGESHDCGGCF